MVPYAKATSTRPGGVHRDRGHEHDGGIEVQHRRHDGHGEHRHAEEGHVVAGRARHHESHHFEQTVARRHVTDEEQARDEDEGLPRMRQRLREQTHSTTLRWPERKILLSGTSAFRTSPGGDE
jgi:hypothetical protein